MSDLVLPVMNVEAALEFLVEFHQRNEGVNLMAISTDKKLVPAKGFALHDTGGMADFLIANKANNLYHLVNKSAGPLSKKADREDIEALTWLHVDKDPPAGFLTEEQQILEGERAEHQLRNYIHPATLIVQSSLPGRQGYWYPRDIFQIGGSVELAEEAKLWNLKIEQSMGGDHCSDVSRIMRVPFTVNWPDPGKIRKGRTPFLSRVVEWNRDRVYDLSSFEKAVKVQPAKSTGFSAADKSIVIPGNLTRLSDIRDLDQYAEFHPVVDWAKVTIVQGHDPDKPGKFPGRSEALFACICEMVRSGVPDEIIYSVITDPTWRISDSVLDKGRRVHDYAVRQIERAREKAIAPEMMEMNSKHAVVGNLGGRCMVIQEVVDPVLRRPSISKQDFTAITQYYQNRWVDCGKNDDGEIIKKPMGTWWLNHPARRQYEQMVFAPGRETPGCYNLWQGFACDSVPGDCSIFLDHLKRNICSGNEQHYDYVMKWMARCVQKPDTPGQVAIVLRGGQGTGKGMFVKNFGSLFGRHYLSVTDANHLIGNFNHHLRDVVVLFADEAFYAGDKRHISKLKAIVTEETLTIEMKGVDVENSPNFIHLIMASNEDWVVPTDADNRRFMILDVGEGNKQDAPFFRAMQHQMDNGGREALLHLLLTMDLSKFEVRDFPRTLALREQHQYSFSTEEDWWYYKLWNGVLIPGTDWDEPVLCSALHDDYVAEVARTGHRRSSKNLLTRFLKRELGDALKTKMMTTESTSWAGKPVTYRAPHYQFPPLDVCRDLFNEAHGGPFDFPETTGGGEDPPPRGGTGVMPF